MMFKQFLDREKAMKRIIMMGMVLVMLMASIGGCWPWWYGPGGPGGGGGPRGGGGHDRGGGHRGPGGGGHGGAGGGH